MSNSPSAVERDRRPDAVEPEPDVARPPSASDAATPSSTDTAKELFDVLVATDALLRTIDLLEFATAERRLVRELEDVPGVDALLRGGGDSKTVADAERYVSSLRPAAKQALVQQEAREKAKAPRKALVAQHAAPERLYASDGSRVGTAGGRRANRNPTAVSSRPPGPLPDGVSTRLSTVPTAVRRAKIDPLPRIYGRRWRRV